MSGGKIAVSELFYQINLSLIHKIHRVLAKKRVANPYFYSRNFTNFMSNRTFTMIKPDATQKGYTGAILDQIIKAGFSVKAMKWTRLTKEQAGLFYEVHKERPFYGELVDFMSSGTIVAAILEKDNAVADFRKLIGATNPAQG